MTKQANNNFHGQCLCGHITFSINDAEPINPHLCSCKMCQKTSGALTVAWIVFPLSAFQWLSNEPHYFRSSEKIQRCSCPKCGCLIAALDDGGSSICLTMATLDNIDTILPNQTHSYPESAPDWWQVCIKA